ncbi:hypothetical protein CASFOL_019637 [Castilleja foliolosa]|uniref:RING-type domain-containing protein n=1 Tax=Castilleja foliolosa TaxID=1961234 RepID=A0ABD3D5J2_9LAMI
MGSENGYYQYSYDFASVSQNDLYSKSKTNLFPGVKAFLFLFTTEFVVKARPEEPSADLTLDSETFHFYVHLKEGDDLHNWVLARGMIRFRMVDYWMTAKEIESFAKDALAFATDRATNDPQYASAIVIPFLVQFKVYTVQQEGESFDVARGRAICEKKLTPLYINNCDYPMVEDPPGNQIPTRFKIFLKFLPRDRVTSKSVDDPKTPEALMGFCLVCKQKPVLGDQILTLPNCNHTFHAHCVVRELLNDIGCPRCGTPAYPDKTRVFRNGRRDPMLEASHCPSAMYSNMASSSKSFDSEDYHCAKAIKSIQMVSQSRIAQGEEVYTNHEVVSLVSSEGETFDVDRAVALKSPVLKGVLGTNSGMIIQLPDSSSNILAKLVELMNDTVMSQAKVNVKEFESKFVKDFDLRMLCDLQKVVCFLWLPFLPEITSSVLADRIKGLTGDELRKDFTLFEDYTVMPKH